MKKNSLLNDMFLGLIIGLALTPFVALFLILTEPYTKIGSVDIVTVGLVTIPCFMILFAFVFKSRKNKTEDAGKK